MPNMMNKHIELLPEGDSGILIRWPQEISREITAEVSAAVYRLRHARIEGITDIVPAYCSILVCFDPTVIPYSSLYERVFQSVYSEAVEEKETLRHFEIPVYYGGGDMEKVTEHTGLTEEEVIAIHSSPEYLVHMIGFLPGFAYLGGMDERLTVPRLKEPRAMIPERSVGIGGSQTGIYPLASPGGWNLIGRTPVRLYDPSKTDPVLLRTGDLVRFVPVDEETCLRMEQEASEGKGCYRLKEGEGSWVSV